jgi:dTDP-4-dehydrorhamnose reductase
VSKIAFTKVFITGKYGQVGRELVERAAELKIEAISFDSSELNICDREKVIALVAEHRPSVVINAAAYTAVDKAEEEVDLAYAVNRDGVENLALACKAQNIPLIHISTDYVFDGEKNSPYVESDTPNPVGVYGASKYAGEQVLRATWDKHIILRVSWVFGRYGNNFVKTMLRLAKERDELSVVDDQFGAPTSAASIARAIMAEVNAKDKKSGTYHFESNPSVTWFSFTKEIFALAGELTPQFIPPILKAVSSAQFPTIAKRPSQSKLNTEESKPFVSVAWKRDLLKMLNEMGGS